MPDPAKEQEYRAEAERLALASREDQKAIIALHRSVADNPKVRKADREAARERADALERLLGLTPKRRKKKS
jgi:hypothetical protein